jgi:hypothetical protein
MCTLEKEGWKEPRFEKGEKPMADSLDNYRPPIFTFRSSGSSQFSGNYGRAQVETETREEEAGKVPRHNAGASLEPLI